MPVSTEAAAKAAASAIVEMELRGPVGYVTGAVTRLHSDDFGSVQLPMQPARAVSQIVYDSGQVQPVENVFIDGQWISGLPRLVWVTITYDHGWQTNEVPAIVSSILDRLTARLLTNSGDGVKLESIGSYRVEYDADPRWLTPAEKDALSRHSRAVATGVASPSTVSSPPDVGLPFGPFWDEW
jgi:hypothetical protein